MIDDALSMARNRAVKRARASAGPAPAVLAIAVYVLAMPALAGLPRGGIIPLVRPSELLQLAVTGVAFAFAAVALLNGSRWQFIIRPLEWWLLAVAFSASVMPLLWLLARSQPVGVDEILASFPFVKYTALYLLVRLCITTEQALSTVVRATLAAASFITVIALSQALGVGPVIDLLGRFFVSGAEDVVDGGRGTTTIGSSIATGAYLSMSCGLALSHGLAGLSRGVTGLSDGGSGCSHGSIWSSLRWLALAGFLAVGALASGQAGTVLALGVVVLTVAHMHGRTRQLFVWGTPAAVLATIALWPIVAARLADLDQNRGLPGSWVIRWNNISELYLPSLSGRGWLLGVSPDAILSPPDVWRDAIYLESGYLWLLWVGGLPLLVAVAGFLITAWRSQLSTDSSSLTATAVAGRAAVAMIAVISIIDPHLTLRAGADLFFILIALGLATKPLATPLRHLPSHWRQTLAADVIDGRPSYPTARLRVAESSNDGRSELEPEMVLSLTVRDNATDIASASLALIRNDGRLRGQLMGPVTGVDHHARGLAWRAVILSAHSLRLDSLGLDSLVFDPPALDSPALDSPSRAELSDETDGSFDRREIRAAARLARELEIARDRQQPAVYRPNRTATAAGDIEALPAVRFVVGGGVPRWKRTIDLAVGTAALIGTAPLWVVCAALVRRSDDGPILFRQVRIGTGGLPFQIYKFRTMYVDNDDTAHRIQNQLELRGEAAAAKDSDDPRITPIGGLLRRTSLDELPQLINVMRSEMSLVGPRPSLLWESELFPSSSRRRLAVRPGLTGLWQTSGRADVSMAEMLDLDLDYLDRMSPLLDVQCLAKTAAAVVAGDGAR